MRLTGYSMVKWLFDRFKKVDWKGEKYQELMEKILGHNSLKREKVLGKITKNKWDKALGKITTKEKQFVLPDLSDVIPRKGITLNKAALNGKRISNTLRDQIVNDLKESMTTFTAKTGEQNIVVRRGRTAGVINPKVFNSFEEKIKNTFSGYVKSDSRYKMPTNIHTIVVTEIRSNINNTKQQYMEELLKKNRNIEIKKKWIHNRMRSKEPRKGHIEAGDSPSILFNEKFRVNRYKKKFGRWIWTGIITMDCPHDSKADAEDVINCNCDIKYYVKKI